MEKLPEFYPDSDDTYLLMDAIRKDLNPSLVSCQNGLITLEIGPGGGLVSKTFLDFCRQLGLQVFHIMVDVNEKALLETAHQTRDHRSVDYVNGDAFTWARDSTTFKADIVFCNPPYVPSSPINRARDIRASYAGGENGREFIDAFLPIVAERLAPRGVFYFLLEKRNYPENVCKIAFDLYGLVSTLVLEKKIPGEHLYVYRFQHK